MTDDIFKRALTAVADFEFGEKVASVFDDMLVRSVPFYQEMQRMIGWLEREQLSYWQTQIRKRQEALGRAQEALAVFTRLEGVDATYEPAYCDRIHIHCELGEHEKAEEMFYIARQYKEECPRCYFNIADSLSRRRKFDKAIYCWQKTLDLDEA